jgi:hypothetical protein
MKKKRIKEEGKPDSFPSTVGEKKCDVISENELYVEQYTEF